MPNYIAPNASFSVLNAPKSLAAGAPPQTPLGSSQRSPDPLAVMGWDLDLTTPSMGSANTPWTTLDRNLG